MDNPEEFFTQEVLEKIPKVKLSINSKSGDEWMPSSVCCLTASWLTEAEKGAKRWLKTLGNNDAYSKLPSFDAYKKIMNPCIKSIYSGKEPIQVSRATFLELFTLIGVVQEPVPYKISWAHEIKRKDPSQYDDYLNYKKEYWGGYNVLDEDFFIINFFNSY